MGAKVATRLAAKRRVAERSIYKKEVIKKKKEKREKNENFYVIISFFRGPGKLGDLLGFFNWLIKTYSGKLNIHFISLFYLFFFFDIVDFIFQELEILWIEFQV